MTIAQMIAQLRSQVAEKLALRNKLADTLGVLRAAEEIDDAAVAATRTEKDGIDAELDQLEARIADLVAEQARDEAADRLQRENTPAGNPAAPERREQRIEVNESRQYSADSDPHGVHFLRDVALGFMGNGQASARLATHMDQEIHERASAGRPLVERSATGQELRATTTGSFAGLVVPQYLVDLVAPNAKAGRPFADACRAHPLPEQGMTVNISKITTGSSTDAQANQGDSVSETDMDDTLLSPAVQTNAGSQSISRQAIERGTGIDDTTIEDLFRSYGTKLDNLLLNQATNGLTNVATAIAYTDASPTAAELYPKLLAGPAAVEAALLDMDPNDTIAVMHSRRWFWLQSQLTSTWPMFGQPNIAAQLGGTNYAEKYGSGFRGVLPNGTPVVVTNNIATNLGAGTNEDEIYFAAQSECHLWEDPKAPMLIKAEQTQSKKLLVDLVVYGYFAYTFVRRAHAQKVGGTGLVTPTF